MLESMKKIYRRGRKTVQSVISFKEMSSAPVWIIDGREKHGGGDFRILFSGTEENKNFISCLCLAEETSVNPLGINRLWNMGKINQSLNPRCNLIIIQAPERYRRFIRPRPHFNIPEWIYCEINLSQPIETLTNKNHSGKSNMRKITQYGLDFEVTGDREQFDMFYDTMYSKYVCSRYEGQLFPLNFDQDLIANSQLLLIKQDSNYLGGVILYFPPDGSVPSIHSMGITDGNPEYVKMGVSHAVYFYSLKYLREQGYTRVSLGLSKAFLNDGVLRKKRYWSAEARRPGKDRMMYSINIQSRDAATLSFLENNPFIYLDHDTLRAAMFSRDCTGLDDERKVRKMKKQYLMNGIPDIDLFTFGPEGTIKPVSSESASPR